MSLQTLRRSALVAAALLLASCAGTRPLPKYEKPLAHTQRQTVRTTAYTHTEGDHLQYGRSNALGTTLLSSATIRSAAADWSRWPAGTLFRIEETGEMYQVDDYGWALAGTNTIDLYKPSRAAMNAWGVKRVHIEILQWGDRSRSLSVLSGRTKYAHVRRMVAGLREDRMPFESLAPPTLTPPTGQIAETSAPTPIRRAELATPRDEYAASRTPAPRAELVSVRKPFRP